ncbi:MAG: RNA methyltransferase [Firmicutes bacterium]|nr:RNA methyltransferase [Bacillota bacterium]
MRIITSLQNQQLKLYRSLEKRKFRKKLDLIPLEGVRLISDALQRGIVPETVFVRENVNLPFLHALPAQTKVLTVEGKIFDQTAFTESPQGILAIVKKPQVSLDNIFAGEPALILVVDRVQDPGNLGTMLRSAAAAGASGAVMLPQTVDPTNPKALRASMGTYFSLPVVETDFPRLYEALQKRRILLVTTTNSDAVVYHSFDWTKSVAVVVGNEGSGISAEIEAVADVAVTIPMSHAVESLNAATAMSVLFFEAARQRYG